MNTVTQKIGRKAEDDAPQAPALSLEKSPGMAKKPGGGSAVKIGKAPSVGLSKSVISLGKKDLLRALSVGLGWDPAPPAKPGLIAGLFGGGKTPPDMDLDASLIVFDVHGIHIDTIWMRKMRGMGGTIRHSGDNIDGSGKGDKETILINLEKLPLEAHHLVVTVSSFNGQRFDTIGNAELRITDLIAKKELHHARLEGKGSHTGLVMAVMSRGATDWMIRTPGVPMHGRSILDIIDAAQAQI